MKLKKKPKQRSMKALTRELWELCRQITFKRHQNTNGGVDCYTCTQTNLEGVNRQCGHAHPKGACGASMSHDLRLLRPQCYNCNINCGGKGAIFKMNLDRELGVKEADALILEAQRSKGKPVNARDHYTHLIGVYKTILKAL